jgi:hypothetical protein
MERAIFQILLRDQFYPILRAEGFQGSGTTLRRINGYVVHVVNVQGSSGGQRCYINLGVHLSFLPAPDGNEADFTTLKEMECAFRDRLPPPVGFGWGYGEDAEQMNASVRALCDCWATFGRDFFNQHASYPASFVSLLDKLDPSTTHPSQLLTFARIASHLGDTARSSALADEGIRRCSARASGLLQQLQKYASNSET